jgi:hypothetical protein
MFGYRIIFNVPWLETKGFARNPCHMCQQPYIGADIKPRRERAS